MSLLKVFGPKKLCLRREFYVSSLKRATEKSPATVVKADEWSVLLQGLSAKGISFNGPDLSSERRLFPHNTVITPDENFNLSPSVLNLLQRQLLLESYNPLHLLKQRIINYFHTYHRKRFGSNSPLFTICENEPPVVSVYENFDSLLTPTNHVSRRPSDTYYINREYCLRAHTSAHQLSLLRQGLNNFIITGDVYRRDEIDRTHYPCFHQMEGVRTYTSDELFGTFQRDADQPRLFDASDDTDDASLRIPQKQERHSRDAANALVIQLKETLESLCRHIFGGDIEFRWVDAYFPFTHPSFELEIFFDGRWVEVLGCGVMEQRILDAAGAGAKVGWAFGIGLERIAMVLYGIPDIRLFWSKDSGFLSQFHGLAPEDTIQYVRISNQPQLSMDISFWIPPSSDGLPIDSNAMKSHVRDVIRNVGGDLVEQVNLVDEYLNKKTGKLSHCYRIIYRSHERPLTKEEVNVVHKEIGKQLISTYFVEIR